MNNIKSMNEFLNDNIIYGKDGTDFKCGDRVKYKPAGSTSDELFKNKEGEIVDCQYDNLHLVYFDEPMGQIYLNAVDSAAKQHGIEPFRIDLDMNYNKKIKKLKNTKVDPYNEEDWGWVDKNKKRDPNNIPKGHGVWIEKKYLKKI